MRKHSGLRGQQGFTMVELMLVVVIIGIIAGVSLPIYKDSVRRSARNEARSVIVENQAWLERNNTVNNTYLNGNAVPALPFPQSPKAGQAKYVITITNATATTYTLKATPQANIDDKCGTFTIDQTGLKNLECSHTLNVDDCWNGK